MLTVGNIQHMPRQAAFGDVVQKRFCGELFDVEHALARPFAREEHFCTGDGRHAGCVGDRLSADFFEGFGVVCRIVDHFGERFAVFQTAEDAANRGLACVIISEA